MNKKPKQWLTDWFKDFSQITPAAIDKHKHENYFELGWIDSFGFISFVTEIENHFAIKFSNDEFQNLDFSTLIGLASIIEKKIEEQK